MNHLVVFACACAIAAGYDAENLIQPHQEVGCGIICQHKTIPVPRMACEWEYKLPVYKMDPATNEEYLTWIPLNRFPLTQVGTFTDSIQCTYIFEGGFPEDEKSTAEKLGLEEGEQVPA